MLPTFCAEAVLTAIQTERITVRFVCYSPGLEFVSCLPFLHELRDLSALSDNQVAFIPLVCIQG